MHVVGERLGLHDEAHLAAPDGTELDSVRWGGGALEIPKGQSIGRKPNAAGSFVIFEKPSRGTPNP